MRFHGDAGVNVHDDGAVDLDVVLAVDLDVGAVRVVVHVHAGIRLAESHDALVESAVLHVEIC